MLMYCIAGHVLRKVFYEPKVGRPPMSVSPLTGWMSVECKRTKLFYEMYEGSTQIPGSNYGRVRVLTMTCFRNLRAII
jgi:hypothetical protein